MLPFNMGAGGASGVDTGDIGHSLRCRGAASTYLNRTFSTPTSNTGWAFSAFVKRGGLTGDQCLFGAAGGSDIRFNSANQIAFVAVGTSVAASTALFRDPTAAGHLFVRSNGTNIKAYWNNLEVASYTGTITGLNAATAHTLARYGQSSANYLDGYLSRVCFVDNGGSLTPGDFAYLNTEINEWVTKSQSEVKAVVDAGGANSTMLDFDDPNFATYNVGKDYSSKGNHWTPNNFSLTAGTSYDWMLDVPGNSYPTWNPLSFRTAAGNIATFSAGNLNVINTSTTAGAYTNSTMPLLPGETWFEATVIGSARSDSMVGIADALVMNTVFTNTYAYLQNGNIYANSATVTTGATYTVGDVIGVKANRTTNKLQFYKQTGGAGAFVAQGTELTINANIEYFAHTSNTYSSGYAINFGQRPLNQTGVSQSTLLCQRNLPDPAILNPEKHFDVDTYTGTGSAINRTGFSLQPDFVWIKGRASAYTHALFDSVRGITKVLNSNTTDAEATEAGGAGLTALNSDGYSLGTNAADASTNVNTQTFAAWLWKAGGTAVSNTAGSITSQVSANVDAGFSIVTYTGTGANATVGHGLGKVPSLVIAKCRGTAGFDWITWHNNFTGLEFLYLNSTLGKQSGATVWNSTIPTSTVFSLGSNGNINTNGATNVAYCFAEIPGFSKIFSYTGNGSADGPFVHCGFKPKYVLIKRVDAAATWCVIDGVRNPSNVENLRLYPSAATAEETNTYLDATSNGFKVRVDSAEPTMNASGGTYIGIAFADVPAKYSLAR